MCWKLRQVAIRPRRVTGQSALKADCRATSLQPNIEAFIRAVEAGADLNRYLSTKAHRHGYVLAADPEIADSRTWEDKDFLWGPGRSWRGTPSDGGMWPVCRRRMPPGRRRREVTGRRYLSRGQDEAASDQRSRTRSRGREGAVVERDDATVQPMRLSTPTGVSTGRSISSRSAVDRLCNRAQSGAQARNSPSISDVRRTSMSGSRAENGRKPNFA